MDLVTRTFALRHEDDSERVVRGVVTRPAGRTEPLPGVLVLHGLKGFIRWGFSPELQARIARAGFVSIAFNLSGSGVGEDLESFTDDEGFLRSTPSRDVEDVASVRRFLGAGGLGVDLERLALFGHSRGGGTALLAAAGSGDYAALVTWAAVSRTVRSAPEVLAAWRAAGVLEIPNARTGQIHRLAVGWLEDAERNADALDILAAAARLATPTLLVHGTADDVVQFEEARALARAFQPGVATLRPIEGGGHTFGAVHPWRGTTPELEEAFQATLAFLGERLGRGGR